MGILAECPLCHQKQATKNKKCKCGYDLAKGKRSKKVKFWVSYYLPDENGKRKQKREPVKGLDVDSYSIEDAKLFEAKKKILKKEKKIFDVKEVSTTTFSELAEWYLSLEKVKGLASYWVIELSLKKFNAVFGHYQVVTIKAADLENYQEKRKKAGKAPATIDHEIGKSRTMIRKAFDNGLVDGEVLRTFNKVKNTLKPGSDVRDRILSKAEFNKLMEHAAPYIRPVIAMGYYTGMRRGEILGLTLDRLDLKKRMIYLEKEDTKDNEPRNIPICNKLYKILIEDVDTIRKAEEDNTVFLYRKRPIE